MSHIILQTDRALVRSLSTNDSHDLAELLQCDIHEATSYIEAWTKHEVEHNFTVYGVFLKKSNKLIGYCGCKEITWEERPEVELLWNINREFPDDPNDDLDIETTFYIRNYIFKKFNLKSVFSFVQENDSRGIDLAEEIDMVCDQSYEDHGEKWRIYYIKSDFPKFLSSFGSAEVEPMLSSSRTRKYLFSNPLKKIKSTKPRPF